MTVIKSFANYLQGLGIATLGQDLWIGEAPSSMDKSDSLWWIIGNGGQPIKKNQTGESRKIYQIQVFFRNSDTKIVEEALFDLEETLNCDGCTQLDGFDTIDIEATTFPVDDDIDLEDRKVGMLQATLTIYKECN